MQNLIPPYGGTLSNLIDPAHADHLKCESVAFPSIDLNQRQLCDVELLLNGGYSPLQGFMGRSDHERVLADMRLADGTFWPLPVTLDVDAKTAAALTPGCHVALRDLEGFMLAVLTVSDIWEADKPREAEALYGTSDPAHPGVDGLMRSVQTHYVGGKLEGVALPVHHDYSALWFAPSILRSHFARRGWRKIAVFPVSRVLHRAEHEFAMRAAADHGASLLICPMAGMARSDTLDYHNKMRCHQVIMRHYPAATTTLALLPLATRMAGAREALMNAIIYRNHGCTHFIVDEQDADADEVRALFAGYQKAVGVELAVMPRRAYVEDLAQYMPVAEVPPGARTLEFSGAELRRRLEKGLEVPAWFSYPEVIDELRKSHPPRSERGFTVFFTGLSGAGKSTIARALLIKLLEMGGRDVTLLDGDLVRKHLSSELGFSKEHRDLNVRRIGYVASEITRHGGIAVCAPIAPYAATRRAVREMIEPLGGFFEVHVSTPLEVCEGRDRKGLYAKARAGLVKEFTGISDPYEAPENPEVSIDTSGCGVDEAVQQIILRLECDGYLR